MRVAGNMRGGRVNRGMREVLVPLGGSQGRQRAVGLGLELEQLRERLEAACRVTTAAPVLDVVGSTRPARWFRRPVCGPECGPGEQ